MLSSNEGFVLSADNILLVRRIANALEVRSAIVLKAALASQSAAGNAGNSLARLSLASRARLSPFPSPYISAHPALASPKVSKS